MQSEATSKSIEDLAKDLGEAIAREAQPGPSLQRALDLVNKIVLEKLFQRVGLTKTVALLLGICRRGLHYKCKRYGVVVEDNRKTFKHAAG